MYVCVCVVCVFLTDVFDKKLNVWLEFKTPEPEEKDILERLAQYEI